MACRALAGFLLIAIRVRTSASQSTASRRQTMFYKVATAFAAFLVLGQAMADETDPANKGGGKGIGAPEVSKAGPNVGPGAEKGKPSTGPTEPGQGPVEPNVGPTGPNVGPGPSTTEPNIGPSGPNVGPGPGPAEPNV